MVMFFRLSLVYLFTAIGLTAVVRENAVTIPAQVWGSVSGMGRALSEPFAVLVILALCLVPVFQRKTRAAALRNLALALAANFAFFSGFFLLKTSLPMLAEAVWGVRYAADIPLLYADRALHFGVDPWRIVHGMADAIAWPGQAKVFAFLYTTLWIAPSMLFPLFLALWDHDPDRSRRYLWLYAFSWIVLGNVVPVLFLAAGPIYVERLHGMADFAPLGQALIDSGLSETTIGWQQGWLWEMYTTNEQGLGTGISAFPSGHLALATILALYVRERFTAFQAPMWVFLGLTLLLSVYTGYHYAIDGYASILVVLLLAWALKTQKNDQLAGLTYRGN